MFYLNPMQPFAGDMLVDAVEFDQSLEDDLLIRGCSKTIDGCHSAISSRSTTSESPLLPIHARHLRQRQHQRVSAVAAVSLRLHRQIQLFGERQSRQTQAHAF